MSRRLHGQRSATEASAQRQKVKPAEERVLVDFIKESADRGFPLVHSQVEDLANSLLASREGPDAAPVGQNWVDRFLTRHRDELQTHWSRPLDTQRAAGLNPAAVDSWFKLVKEQIHESGALIPSFYSHF